jgi:hypothetical protein
MGCPSFLCRYGLLCLTSYMDGLLLVGESPYREMRCRMRFEFAGTERLGL